MSLKRIAHMLYTLIMLLLGRIVNRSGSTIAKYVNLKDTPAIVTHTSKEVVRG